MILKSSTLVSSKAIKKYEDMRDIESNYLFKFIDIDLYYPQVEIIEPASNRPIFYKRQKIDIKNLTCSCSSTSANNLRQINNLCPHLIHILKTGYKKYLLEITLLLLANRLKYKNEVYIKLKPESDNYFVISMIEDSKWLNVYLVNKSTSLFKYDGINKKWAYNILPSFTKTDEIIFENLITNNLLLKNN
ncbi:MAG: hypothetical protein V1773_11880 [bacterium]